MAERMFVDRSTVIGILLGLGLITGSILVGPSAAIFWNLPAVLIVFGGVVAATLIRFPAPIVLGTARVVRQAFLNQTQSPIELVRDIVRLAVVVRRDSLLAMEREKVRDEFLRRGVEQCIDGADPATIESSLRAEIASVMERHDRGQRIFRGMGASAPGFGMIGTLIGLVQMMTKMNDPSTIGGAMAVAILTTLYGAFLAYLIFLPLADKLAERSRQEAVNREIVVQGLLSILSGHHPRMVERQLLGLLEPRNRVGYAPRPMARRRAA